MPKNPLLLVLFVCVLSSFYALFGQTESDLKRYFEGRPIIVKLDMPGDKSGIDIRMDSEPGIDYAEIGRRLKTYGISLREGDRVLVTLVKVNKKNIEIQLAGGGYGTFGDSSGVSTPSTYVSKSAREKRLEDELKKETDAKKKKEIREEIDDLRRDREREQARLEMEAAQAKILAEARERQLRETSGSRFNIWYSRGVPPEALTPDAVLDAMARVIEIPGKSSDRRDPDPDRDGDRERQEQTPGQIRKGLTEEEVDRMFGDPVNRNLRQVEDLRVVNSTYAHKEGEVRVVFVEGVVVRYSISSK